MKFGPKLWGWVSVAASGLMKTVLGKKRGRGRGCLSGISSSEAVMHLQLRRMVRRKKRQKSEFAKEIHCTLKKKSWRRKEIQTERKWAFASTNKTNVNDDGDDNFVDNDDDNFVTFYIDSFNKAKKKE